MDVTADATEEATEEGTIAADIEEVPISTVVNGVRVATDEGTVAAEMEDILVRTADARIDDGMISGGIEVTETEVI